MIALNTQFAVHLRENGKFRQRPVPIVALREGFENEDAAVVALIPDTGDSNRLIEVPAESLAVCFGTCRICQNAKAPDEPRRRPVDRRY